MMALLLKSLKKRTKEEKRNADEKSLQGSREGDGRVFCQPWPYLLERRLQKKRNLDNQREVKSLGPRIIKVWAAVCRVNQHRPDSGCFELRQRLGENAN